MKKQKPLNFSRGRAVSSKEPKWELLMKATTEEERLAAWNECEYFVHSVITSKEYIHSARKWIRDFTDWNLYQQAMLIPDPFFALIAKDGWKAYVLKYMPVSVENHFKRELLSLISRVDSLRKMMHYESPIHASVTSLPEDDELHYTKVKAWIDVWKKFIAANRKNSGTTEYQTATRYVQNMQTYLSTGVWLDSHFGEKRERKMHSVCIAPAYDKDGMMKRTVGVYYRDIACVWTREMRDESVYRPISK